MSEAGVYVFTPTLLINYIKSMFLCVTKQDNMCKIRILIRFDIMFGKIHILFHFANYNLLEINTVITIN